MPSLALGANASNVAFTQAGKGASLFSKGLRLVGIAGRFALGPIGLVMIAIEALSWLAGLVYEHWEPIKEFFNDIWGAFPDWVKTALKFLMMIINPVGMLVGLLFGGDDEEDEDKAPKKATVQQIKKVTEITDMPVSTANEGVVPVAMGMQQAGLRVIDPENGTALHQPAPAPLQAYPTGQGGLAHQAQVQNNYDININVPTGGVDAQAIADAVRAELERIEREKAQDHQSRLYD